MTLTRITPGQPITSVQKIELDIVSVLGGGRDIVLAIDITESVGLNDEGHIRLRQIIEDSLKPGDSVYIVPFAQHATLDQVLSEAYPLGKPLYLSSKSKENIDKILEKIPSKPDTHLYGTDIQRAELTIYQGIAQINQNRLQKNQPIKRQSVVWITDAPLFTQPGITSQVWVETSADSPFRNAESPESKQREVWIKALPLKKRSLSIVTKDNKEYKLTVVDIAPTAQEFCTPVPGGQDTCLINPYLVRQLWLTGLISLLVLLAIIWLAIKFHRLQKKWYLIVSFEAKTNPEDQKCSLPNNKRIAIGEYDSTYHDSIDCPGVEVKAYLERTGEKLYLVPNNNLVPIYYNGKEITSRTLINKSSFRLNVPEGDKRDYEIIIKVNK